MGSHRPRFADEYENKKAPAQVWVVRSMIAGILVGLASAAHVIFGLPLF